MKGKRRKVFSKVIAVLMAVAFAFTLVPASPAKAAEGDDETTNSGIVLSKTATLEDDGTYTINLEAYATGTTTTITEKSGVPLDIVLVIDQSGSMAYNDDGDSTETLSDRRIEKLKDAVTGFVNNISANAREYDVEHRIAIAGYASNRTAGQSRNISGIGYNGDSENWVNTGLYINGSFKNYGGSNSNNSTLTSQDYQEALVSVNDLDGNVNTSITNAIGNFKASGGTYTEYGMTMAQKVFDNNAIGQDSNRKRIVVLFTDGETDSSISSVLDNANALKGSPYNATIYSVGFGKDVESKFLSHVSSNYLNAGYSWWNGYSGTKVDEKYSMVATNREELKKIFTNISQDIQQPSTDVTLNEEAIMRDVIADGFILPEDYDASTNIEIKTVSGSTTDGSSITWGEETASPSGIMASVKDQNVDITGFNYSDKYIAPGHDGEKLVVTIKGVEATDAAITNNQVDTNAETSGIYQNSSASDPIDTFPQPKTILTSKAYVLDYAKEVTLNASDWKQSGIRKITSSMEKKAEAFSATYGNITKAADNSSIAYQPKTTKWDGYDSFYVFGTTSDDTITAASANTNGNLWSKVSVIPANNVYYEDDFETSDDGTVGIVYSGDWNIVGESANNTETANNATHGWVESMADDAAYSAGSAHQTSTDNATATFTFTGTGVDIYSRTDLEVGKVRGQLYKGDNTTDASMLSKVLMVDNLSESGTYYQIPTLSFQDLEYGTYTVKLTVGSMSSSTSENGKRSTYYLDGIRVYNPIKDKEDDNTVKNAYGDAELNAKFTEVRDMLLEAGSFGDSDTEATGFVFIDEVGGTTGVESNAIGTYEDYGPKNEVYLAKGQSIAFKVDGNSGNYYYLGLKAPNGATTVQFTNGESTSSNEIKAASDLYYNVTPNSNGIILVKNTGDNLLSITKLRTTGITASGSGLMSLRSVELLSYADEFDSLPVVAYSNEAVSEEPDAENPGEGTEVENPEEGIGADESGDVIIDNPQPEEKPEEKPVINTPNWLNKIFNVIRGWFGRR